MCWDCWERAGSPKIDTAAVRAAAAAVSAHDDRSDGVLAAIDDYNLTDDDLSRDEAALAPEAIRGREAIRLLRALPTVRARVSAMALADELWSTAGVGADP